MTAGIPDTRALGNRLIVKHDLLAEVEDENVAQRPRWPVCALMSIINLELSTAQHMKVRAAVRTAATLRSGMFSLWTQPI